MRRRGKQQGAGHPAQRQKKGEAFPGERPRLRATDPLNRRDPSSPETPDSPCRQRHHGEGQQQYQTGEGAFRLLALIALA